MTDADPIRPEDYRVPDPTATAHFQQGRAIYHLKLAQNALNALSDALAAKADPAALKQNGGALRDLRAAISPPQQARVVKSLDLDQQSALPPPSFLEAYSMLTDRVYGPFITTFQDDTAVNIRASRWRIDGKDEVRGGAKHQKKKLSNARRTVVLDLRAYEHKKRIDMKLRRLATECRAIASGEDYEEESLLKCPSCGKIQLIEWRFCPRCGDNLTVAKDQLKKGTSNEDQG